MIAQATALDCHVLVLNKHFLALRITDARRAFGLLYRRIAEVIHIEDGQYLSYDFDSWREVSEFQRTFEPERHDWVRTVRYSLAVPRIIRLISYDRMPQMGVKLNRRNIYARDKNHCQYCGKRFSTSELSLDHVVPRSRGGDASWENLVCSCLKCNVRKGGRTPEEAGMKLITRPARPRRSPVIHGKLRNAKYASWKQFLDHAYWSVELK